MLTLACLNALTVVVFGLLVFWEIKMVNGTDVKGLTFIIPPRAEECFYERMEKQNLTMVVHYSVIASRGGDYGINFQVSDFAGRPMVTEFRKAISQVSIVLKDAGDYKLCFDNSMSSFSSKTIAFEITADKKMNANWEAYDPHALEPEGQYELRINDIQDVLQRVRIHVNDIQGSQDSYRTIEARDRSLSESNFEYINFWSTISTILLLLVGIVQVILMRSFFEDKKKSFLEIACGIFTFLPLNR